jgi:hypothetical protein
MKRIFAALIALVLCLSLMAACGSRPAKTDDPAAALEKIDAKIDDYISKKGNVEAVELLNERFAGLYTCSMKREEHKFVFEFKMAEGVDAFDAEKSIEAAGNAAYLDMLSELHKYVGSKDVVMVLRYVSAAGETLYEAEFDKDTERVEVDTGVTPGGSLKDLVSNETFLAQMKAQESEDVKIELETEGEDTLVLKYVLQYVIPAANLDAAKAEEAEILNGAEMMDAYKLIFTGAGAMTDVEDMKLKVRIVDLNGEVLGEKVCTAADFE